MRERPEGLELLEVAVRTLRHEVVPALPADERDAALMVANAIAIAHRQLARDERPLQWLRGRLLELLGPQEGEGLDEALGHLEAHLARRIREGHFDDSPQAKRVLWDIAVHRARESSPRYFETEGID